MKVLVTGASGFVAGHIVKVLLEHGHHVVGTVRDLNNAEATAALQLLAAQHPGKLELVVADLLVPGTFDAHAKGCDAVIHTASPFFRKPKTAAELVEPAVKGTENVLAACAGASSVRRLVVTGSFASMIFAFDHTKTPERAYCEDDWNAISTADHPEPMHWYRASKILAERACWDYVEKNKPHFDIAVINPPMIIGPWLPGYARPNESSMILKEFLTGEKTEVMIGGVGWVDVRDVAKAHVAAMENPAAQGRYLISSETWSFLQIARYLKELYPDRPVPTDPPKLIFADPKYNTSKAARDLGMTSYIPIKDSIQAQCKSFEEAGLLK